MSDLPTAGAKLELDLTSWNSSWDSVMADAEALQNTIDDLSASVDVEVNLDIPDTSSLDDIQALDGETISPEVNVTEDEESKSILDGLNFLVAVEKIKIAISIVGNVLEFAEKITNFVATPFLDVEDAVARINAQTGGTGIADLGQFIRDIQAADLGTGIDQIGQVVIAAQQLGAPIDEATRAALTFTHTFDNQDPVTVLTTLNTLVQTGLVPNLQAAADLMTVAFQQGVNKGGDALNVVNANAQSWADMGLNGTQALSAINSLQDAGVDSATDAAKMIQTLDDALTTAAANADSPQAEALKTLGMENPKDSGQVMGADFIDGFASSFANLPADQQDLISGVLFGKGGKKFTGALEGLTTQGGPFGDIVGAASDAATEIDNSLRGAIDDFVLAINTKISELLSSESIDLPGKIDALKQGLQDALDVLAAGGTPGEALEVALNIPGLSDTLNTFIGNFERLIGNLEIAFLQVVAGVQEVTGHGKEAEATRKTVANLGSNQLAFDLQLANADEIPALVNQALSRGVTDIGTPIQTALNESLKNADFDQGATILQGLIDGAIANGQSPDAANRLAATYVSSLSDGFDNALSTGNLDLLQKMLEIDPNAKIPGLDDAVAAMQKQLSDAFAPQDRTGEGGNPFMSGMLAGPGKQSATSGGVLGSLVQGATDAVSKITDTTTALSGLDTATDTAATNMGTNWNNLNVSVSENTAAVIGAMDETSAKVTELDAITSNKLTDNTVTASFNAVAASAAANFPAVIAWFDRTAKAAITFDSVVSVHLRSVIKQLNDLNFLAMVTIGNVTQAQALGGAGGTTNNTTNNVVVNNNVNGPAAADATGYVIAKSLRPGGR